MAKKAAKIILSMGIMLLVFIIVSVSLINFTLDLDDSINSSIVVIDIEYTDNGNVIIMHDRGPSLTSENIIITVDGEKANIEFEDESFEQSQSVILNEKPNGEEFTGGERIDVYVGEEEQNISTKIIPHN